ncbi:hypothetical protein [Nocardioides kribbensis]|uniref:DUF2530 domain-containing protein n=2 Tax=Nocardioides kribbensis TaxID=305517 RepID=A0ABV1NYL6_9ACTN|nr:hypothetical protein [Nocardioides kribbensis]
MTRPAWLRRGHPVFAGFCTGTGLFLLAFLADLALGDLDEFEVGWWVVAGTSVALVTGGLLRHEQRRRHPPR